MKHNMFVTIMYIIILSSTYVSLNFGLLYAQTVKPSNQSDTKTVKDYANTINQLTNLAVKNQEKIDELEELSKKLINDRIDLTKHEQHNLSRLSNTVQVVTILLGSLGVVLTGLGILGFINLKNLFNEKLKNQDDKINTQDVLVNMKIDNLRPIFEKQAMNMAERDLTIFMEKMLIREITLINIRRKLIFAKAKNSTTPEELFEINYQSQEIGYYLTRLFIHPYIPGAVDKIRSSLYYFDKNPNFYLIDSLNEVKETWQEDPKIYKLFDNLIDKCEREGGPKILD